MADTPQLGYGQRGEAPIDAVNIYMRSTPWYQALIKSFGQDPNNVHLNDSQKQQVIRAAQANGIIVDEGHNGQEVDDSGNFQAKSHALRNTLIVAGIAAAALATMGAAGVFSGAGGAAAGGTTAASEGTLASLGTGAGAAAADVGAGALAPAVAAGGVEAGAASGLGSLALPGAGTALGGASAAAPLGVGAATVDAATNGAFDAAGNFVGPSTLVGETTGGGIGSTIGKIASSNWFPAAIGAATGLGGAAIQSSAIKDAAAIQAQSAKDALDFAKSQAALEQKNFAPYLAAGTGSLSKLSYGLGIGSPTDYAANGAPAPKPAAAGPTQPDSTRSVWMTAPTGERSQVPAAQVQAALQKGATLDAGRTMPPETQPVGTAVVRP